MVAPKGIEGGVKKKDEEVKSTSSSPEPFQEPDGMTTIDLNKSDDCGKESAEDRAKLKQRAQIKYVSQLLTVLCSFFVIFMVVFTAAFLNKEYQLFTSIPFNTANSKPSFSNIPSTSTEDIFDLTKIFNQAMFQQRLKAGRYLDDSYDKMDVCRVQQTFEACCNIFKQTDLHELLDYCTVNDMLHALRQYDTEQRRKRYANYQGFPYEYVGNQFLPASVLQEHFANDEQQNFQQKPPISPPDERNFQILPDNQMVGPQNPANEFLQTESRSNKDFLRFSLPEQTKTEQIWQHVSLGPKQEVPSYVPKLNPEIQNQNLPAFPGPLRHENVRVGEFSNAEAIRGKVADNVGLPVNIEPRSDLTSIRIPSPIQMAKQTEHFSQNYPVGAPQERPLVSNFGNLVEPFSTDSQISSSDREIAPSFKITNNNNEGAAYAMFLPNRENEPNAKISKKNEELDGSTMVIPDTGRAIPASDAIVGTALQVPLVSKYGNSVKIVNQTEIGDQLDDTHNENGSIQSSRPANSRNRIEHQDQDSILKNSQKKSLVSQFEDSVKFIATSTMNSNKERPIEFYQDLQNTADAKIYKENGDLDGNATAILDNGKQTQWADTESNARASVQGRIIPGSEAIVGFPVKSPLVSKYGNTVQLVNETEFRGQPDDTHVGTAPPSSSRAANSQYRIEHQDKDSFLTTSQKMSLVSQFGDSVKFIATNTTNSNKEQPTELHQDLENLPNAQISNGNEDFDANTRKIPDKGNHTRSDDFKSNARASLQGRVVSASEPIAGFPVKSPLVSKYGNSVKLINETEIRGQQDDIQDHSAPPQSSRAANSQYKIQDPASHSIPENLQKKFSDSTFEDVVKIVSTSTETSNTGQLIDQYSALENSPNAQISKENENFDANTIMIPDSGKQTRIDDSESNARAFVRGRVIPTSDVIVEIPHKAPLVSKYGNSVKVINETEIRGQSDDTHDGTALPPSSGAATSHYRIENQDKDSFLATSQKKSLVSQFGDSVKFIATNTMNSNKEQPTELHQDLENLPNAQISKGNEEFDANARKIADKGNHTRSDDSESNARASLQGRVVSASEAIVGFPVKSPLVSKYGSSVKLINETVIRGQQDDTQDQTAPSSSFRAADSQYIIQNSDSHLTPKNSQKKLSASKFEDSVKIVSTSTQNSNTEQFIDQYSAVENPPNAKISKTNENFDADTIMILNNGNHTQSDDSQSNAKASARDRSIPTSDVIVGSPLKPLPVLKYGRSEKLVNKTEDNARSVNAVFSSDVPTTEPLLGNPHDKFSVLKFNDSVKVNFETRINSAPNLNGVTNSSDSLAVRPAKTQNLDATRAGKDSVVEESLQKRKFEGTLLEDEENRSQYLEEISNRANNGQDDFRTKAKQLGAFENIQSTQQMFSNPCFYPYMNPYMPLMPNPSRPDVPPMDPGYLKVVPASQPRAQNQPMFVLNPSMVYSTPQSFPPNPFMSPSYFSQMPVQQPMPAVQPANPPIQVTGPGGQYYTCNPIPTPTNNVAGLAQVEVRREVSSLQDLISDFEKFTKNNKSRAAGGLICPLGEHSCLDNSKCIKKHHLCDNEVHCDDSSDEVACSCKDRVGKLRMCDGYCDCPKCEDEDGCFGCSEDEFSCDDWSRFRRSTCIPLVQRCDGIKQCEITGKDELDCSILADHLGNFPLNKISNAVGFLHRNYKGKWYPTCFGTELWAAEVCQIEAGPSAIIPKAQMTLTPEDYQGVFVSIFPNNKVNLVNTCVQDRATFVECPPLYCGLRFLTDNPYRAQEVDTSIEEMLNDLERAYNLRNVDLQDDTLGESLKKDGDSEDEQNSEDDGVFEEFKEKFDTIFRNSESDLHKTEEQLEEAIRSLKRRHTEGRVVGGKPSQPSAWPWLVSIYKNGIFHCAGVLINELWIVTASHCVDRYWQYYYEIQAGTLRRFSYAPMDQRRWAKVVIFHEQYDKENLRNDIALMKLSAPIRYNRHVRPICLPSESSVGKNYLKAPSFGTVCTTVGWGATIEHGSDPDHMREVEVPIMKYCKHKEDSNTDEICAGIAEGGKDACQGDSGGPLMCRNPNNNNQWYLAGIVSHGQGCARPGEPGVYTRVSRYIGWIAEHTRENQLIMAYPLQRCPGFVCKGIKRCIAKKRRCDGTVDCLFGDDEMDCDRQYNEIFKHSRKSMITQQLSEDFESQEEEDNSEIVGLAVNSTWAMKNNLMEGFDGLNFRCKVMLQVVPMEKRCDRHFDCEDGTDEANCSCAHYVKTVDPDAVCDGISDCADLSDEHGCLRCNQTQFPCRISQQCIEKSKRCDGKSDCSQNEDELDCVSLTNGLAVTLDRDNRPLFHSRGLVTVNQNGVWRTMCLHNNSETSVIASSVCSLLGLNDYMSYTKYTIDGKVLMETRSMSDGKLSLARKSHECEHCCDGIFVSCSNISTSSTLRYKSLDQVNEVYFSPWMVALYSDGVYLCMGTLLDQLWVLTSAKCMDNIDGFDKNYTVAVMGKGKMHLSVQGPHDQILRVITSTQVQKTDILLLRVESEVKFNRYVQAANMKAQWDGNYKEKCYAVGQDNGNKAIFVKLFSIEECMEGYRCFGKKIEDDCNDNNAWIGTIICDSRLGWYPAAVFNEEEGHCGLSARKKYTSVKFYNNEILAVTSGSVPLAPFVETPCNGLRCPLGQCLSQEKICDGVRDCYNGMDETQELCYQRESKCYLGEQCACPLTDLKCPKSLKCVSKSVFCNGVNDCGEHEDEPPICSCRSYLQLTNPQKICDGIVHCADRTDEDPEICDCKPSSYQCGKSNKCVPLSLVCDGQKDCPNGEDEGTCLTMKAPGSEKRNAGEVMTRTAGIWHSGCFKLAYSPSELNELCAKLGFEGTRGYQLSDKANQTVLASRPILGSFDVVWLSRVPKRQMKMLMRSSSEPVVNFTKDNSCYRLFVACV